MVKQTKSNLVVNNLGVTKIGRITETPIEIYKSKGDVTINDVNKLKKKLIADAKMKYQHADVMLIKVLAGSWMTFTSEEKFNEYFDSKVLDPSKFYEFEKVVFYLQTE
jgi:hypothetical protein